MLLGFEGAIKTKIRAVLTPHPMKEMRVKGEYINHDVIYASMGIKIAANGLEEAVAGSALYLANTPEEEETARVEVERQLEDVKNKVKLSPQVPLTAQRVERKGKKNDCACTRIHNGVR